jgi:hypothetical protein
MADLTEQSESREPDATWKFWMAEIEAARKREKDWRKEGEDILKLYEANAETPAPFNILYSNTETMMPALYSRVPRPYVERRFKDNDAMGFHAAKAGTRILEFLLDTNLDNYDNFHEAIKQSTLAAVLPGRGWTSIKYEAEITGDVTQWETICPEINSWKKVYHGYARKWTNVPWVAYEKDIDKEEAERLFGKELAKKLNYTSDRPEGDDKDKKDQQDQHRGERKTCPIYKIWDKDGGKMVRWFSPNYKDGMLKEEDDPLGLSGFFDCPKPLQFIEKHDSLLPTAPYSLYRRQAQELNELTRRILRITQAIKARGVYDGSLGQELKKVMESDDNELVPADSASSLATEKGFENAIWFLPIEQLVVTLRELVAARELCKQTIYEITGISDILRGATKASETLGAQEIKNQWGTLRLKNKQAEVQRFSRDLLRMTLELAASKFSEETWAQMTGLPFSTTMQRQQAMQVLQAAQLSGQPPDPQAAAIMQAPAWADVIKMLQDDLQRAYRIDIETNSTVEPEAAEDQKAIMEMLVAVGQVLNGLAPLVQSGSMPFQMAQEVLLMIVRRFRYGSEMEEAIKKMQPPQQPDEQGAEKVQKEKEFAAKELDMQKKQAEGDIKMKMMDAEMKLKQQEMDLQLREAQLKVDQDVFKMNQQAADTQLKMKADSEGQKLDFQAKKNQLENGKYKTENVANQKVDQGLQKGIGAMQDMVKQLMQTVQQQSQQTDKMMQALTKALTAPRVKKAIRGKDGRLEAVEEQVA